VSGDVYGYDAVRDRLSRLSAPSGGVGGSYPCRYAGPILGVASDPLVPGDQIAFFQSRSRLVQNDTDAAYDVYQWRNGELSLLTPGDSAPSDGQMLKGNDASGRDVYFATRDRMTWQDVDSVLDVYTARIGGGIVQPSAPPLCGTLVGACQSVGIGVPTTTQPVTGKPSSGGASPRARTGLSIAGLSRKARARAARSGVLPVRVRLGRAGVVRLVARARVGKRRQLVARGSVRLGGTGARTVRLRLSGGAKRALRGGKRLRISIRASSAGARPRTVTVPLKRSN
jgi:hypothetical protein